MTEKEKMLAGMVYDAVNPELQRELQTTREVLHEWNALPPSETLRMRAVLKGLLGFTADDCFTFNQPFRCDYGKQISIGKRFFANFNFVVLDEAPVSIGDDCFIGPNVSIYTACHSTDPVARNTRQEWARPVTIGNNVWIGGSVTILPGVTIGDNVTVGAGSVVVSDIPSGTVAVGNPCRVVRRLPAYRDIYLAGGCFWGTEHYFKQIEGVVETSVGFANGRTANPTYKEVYTDTTGYAETVHVRYNPAVVSLEFLLQMFFKAIDPTSLNKQGHDEGTRYRTGVYYTDAGDLPVIEKVFGMVQKDYEEPLCVEKQPLENYYTAEEYHQDYLDKNPDGYCHLPWSLFEFARQAKPKPGSL